MAITLADFNKIWASTSPLTPYSFSESNYKQGWNFIGSTPPARQMWDFLQKNNDEKMQYLANNYLPLSGGTMTGYLTMGAEYIKRNVDNASLTVCGGTSFSNGAYISFNGKDRSSNAGVFSLVASDGTNSKVFYGTPDGTLVWNGNNIITSALTGNILIESGSSTEVSSYVTLCSITTHPAGVFLITSYMDLSYNGTNIYINRIITANHGSVTTRNTSDSGGGNCAVLLTTLDANEAVELIGYQSQAGTMRGSLRMVRLA